MTTFVLQNNCALAATSSDVDRSSSETMIRLNSLHRSVDYTAPLVDDPRLQSAAHSGQRIQFNVPPRDGHVFTSDVYGDWLDGYSAKSHDSYADIVGGDIEYYFDRDIGRPFLSPLLFDQAKAVERVDYVDPMDVSKPHFYQIPDCCDATRLSWLRDSNFQRQDLMARQIWQRNQSEPIYYYVR